MMIMTRRMTTRWTTTTTTRTTTMIRVSQLWDYIETLDFCEDIEGNRPPDYYNEEDDDKVKANDKDNNNNNDDNDDKGISSLGLDRDLGFL